MLHQRSVKKVRLRMRFPPSMGQSSHRYSDRARLNDTLTIYTLTTYINQPPMSRHWGLFYGLGHLQRSQTIEGRRQFQPSKANQIAHGPLGQAIQPVLV